VAAAGTAAARGILVFDVINDPSMAKSVIGMGQSVTMSAGTAPILNRSAGVWANTSSSIHTVTLFSGSGGTNLTSGTEMVVFGSD
jgi:hypothetical protein